MVEETPATGSEASASVTGEQQAAQTILDSKEHQAQQKFCLNQKPFLFLIVLKVFIKFKISFA